jgi:hypothetical protein
MPTGDRIELERVGGLHIVPPLLGFRFEPQRLLLDANVVIDMERWYFRGRGGPQIGSDLAALFDRYASVDPDVVYGFGAKEAGWRRGSGLNKSAYQKALYAASRIVQWDNDELHRRAASRVAPVADDRRWRSAISQVQVPAEADVSLLMVFMSYGSLLYLLQLERNRARWRQKGPLWATSTYVNWLAAELDFVGSYEVQIGIDLFMGDDARRNGARGLLKFGGSESPDRLARNCWSTAWDVNHLRMAEGETFGLFGESAPTFLVTRDPAWSPGILTLALSGRRQRSPRLRTRPQAIPRWESTSRGLGIGTSATLSLQRCSTSMSGVSREVRPSRHASTGWSPRRRSLERTLASIRLRLEKHAGPEAVVSHRFLTEQRRWRIRSEDSDVSGSGAT